MLALPSVDPDPGLIQTLEPALAKELKTGLTVEALDAAVPRGPAALEQDVLDALTSRPRAAGEAGELWDADIAHSCRTAPDPPSLVQFPSLVRIAMSLVDSNVRAPIDVFNHCQALDALVIGKAIGNIACSLHLIERTRHCHSRLFGYAE